MFDRIARRYDLLNHLLSAGMDLYWRRRALSLVRHPAPRLILDLATGTGDFALSAARLRPERIVGVDVALSMLRRGAAKAGKKARVPVQLLAGDAEELPFRDACFDLVTAAFGVRNFGRIGTGLAEAWRVLRPGGEILVLDFGEPDAPFFRALYSFYFTRILPFAGRVISGDRQAYSYLPESVGTFPQGREFLALLAEAGFDGAGARPLTLGVCSVYQGRKPPLPVD